LISLIDINLLFQQLDAISHKTTYTAKPYTAKKPLQSSENLEIHRIVTTLNRY